MITDAGDPGSLKLVIFRQSVFVDAVVLESCFEHHIRYACELASHVLGLMGIGAYGYDLSAEFAVALESGHAGVEFLHAFAHGFGVDLDSFFIFDEMFEDLINDVAVLRIVVFPCSAGKISDHVIQVSENVEVVELLDVVVILREVFSQGFFFGTSLEK